MKSFAAVIVLLAVASVGQAALDRQKSIDTLTKCKAETGATEDPVTTYDSQIIPETKEGKCMLACALRERGLMKDDKLDAQAFSDFFDRVFADDPDELEKAARVVGICSTVDVKGQDKCEKAYTLFQCGKKNGLRL